VTLFVDLTEEGEIGPTNRRGTSRCQSGLRGAIRSDLRRTLDAIHSELAAGGVVYLHCRGGCGRTGTVVGC
jgi:protein-tyrosine phosphatase